MLWQLICLFATAAFSLVACNTQSKYLASGKLVHADSSPSLHQRAAPNHRFRRDILNNSEIQECLVTHNAGRRNEGSSNMNILTWNSQLAKMAFDYAQVCQWEHGQVQQDLSSSPYNPIGQNLYAISNGVLNITNAVITWYNEKSVYDYNTLTCYPNATEPMCGHYTQVVWATSREVGCAYFLCSQLALTNMTNATLLVCNYGPAGNYVGEKPYLKGPACTQCDDGNYWCNQQLCDRNCPSSSSNCACLMQTCQNYGTFNTNTCSCSCQSGYCGSDCSSTCSASSATNTEVLISHVTRSIGIVLYAYYKY